MARKLIGFLLIFFLIFGSGCKLIYKNRIPVTKPKKRYGWYKPQYKKRNRTKTVWMKVHKGKFKEERPAPATPVISEGPTDN